MTELEKMINEYDFKNPIFRCTTDNVETDLKEYHVDFVKMMLPYVRQEMIKKFTVCDDRLGLLAGRNFEDDELVLKLLKCTERSKYERIAIGLVMADALYYLMGIDYKRMVEEYEDD